MICENPLPDIDCEEECRTKCYSCGMAACRPCSRIARRYYSHRNVRICKGCEEDRREDVRSGAIRFATVRGLRESDRRVARV